MTASLTQLLRRRKALKEKLTQLTVELDALDRMIFPRMTKLAEGFEGSSPKTESAEPSGSWDSSFRRTNAVFHTPLPINAARLDVMPDGTISALNGVLPDASVVTIDGYLSTVMPLPVAKNIADAVQGVLEQAGKPMKTTALHNALMNMGIAVPGQNPINNLSARLSNDKRFFSTKDGWTIRSPSLISELQTTPAEG